MFSWLEDPGDPVIWELGCQDAFFSVFIFSFIVTEIWLPHSMVPAWVMAQLWPLVRSAPCAQAMELDHSDILRFPLENLCFIPYTFHSSVGFFLFCFILTLARIAAVVAVAWFLLDASPRKGSLPGVSVFSCPSRFYELFNQQNEFCDQRITEWFRLEETFKDHLVQPFSHRQGQFIFS